MEDEKALAQIANCAMCANMCKHSCPTYLASGSETITPQKIARLILYEEKGLLEDRRAFADVMFSSAMCGACRRHCIYDDYDLRRFIHAGRAKVFQEGMLPDETRKRVETYNTFGNPDGQRDLVEKGTGEVGYFISCSAYKDQDLRRAMDRIISAGGQEVHQFGGADICCGAPLYYAGDIQGFSKAAEKMKSEIEKRKLKTVVADCPNCMKMMTQMYGEAGVDLGIELVHTTDFLIGLLGDGRIKVKSANATVTFHDPCILVNDLGIAAQPREVLGKLGYEIREPVYSGQDTHCCGAVCGARIGDCGLTNAVTSMRVRELRQTSADVYATACATCKAVLSATGMKDLAELVSEQMVDEQ